VLAGVVLYSCLVSWLVWGQPEKLQAREQAVPLFPAVTNQALE
jgi:hypothetical protein